MTHLPPIISAALENLESKIFGCYRVKTPESEKLSIRARKFLPGGVSGNLRFYRPYPLYMAGGRSHTMTDIDGNDYLDCFLCNGPLLLGHRPAAVEYAVAEAAQIGALVLNPKLMVDCAELLCEIVPSAERVRFLSSGTEAVISAVRYARAFTGRSKIVKFFGHYHGQDDQLLVGTTPHRRPIGRGVLEASYANTMTLPFNDIDTLRNALKEDQDIAAVILDPAMHSGGLWGTTVEYLEAVRKLTQKAGVVLIFDEVITGFRLAPGGAQQLYGITPDLTTVAKALGAGERIAAVLGRAEIMSVVDPIAGDPTRRVFQSGTGNDGARGLAAATAALRIYRQHGYDGRYKTLTDLAANLAFKLGRVLKAGGVPCHINQNGPMLQLFFTQQSPSFEAYARLDQRLVNLFFLALLTQGVMLTLPTSNHIYLSFEHGPKQIQKIIDAVETVLANFNFAETCASLAQAMTE